MAGRTRGRGRRRWGTGRKRGRGHVPPWHMVPVQPPVQVQTLFPAQLPWPLHVLPLHGSAHGVACDGRAAAGVTTQLLSHERYIHVISI